ncbi:MULTISPECIES: alpha-hydroxy acid oxidase [Acinetobacter]|uniref:alpha-hydroxy acid oxidase n=1 Tax=Acinetobacter TaxID=469 RepID=UPI0027AA719B|nr:MULTISPECIES: alpha-hydroxy acid oxidase [Acinetobacter]MDY6458671.1 alpha-hydroxy acid oxidase [Acinetobacter faecalis]MDY6483571.1 alpha-hydroxy acid oxidase [Acinetobacter faecalis]MDY6529607.1 alpha-hydroxy acid oxidase [Acinetobacter faecalis]MDY6536790.1 alpha-hydroxy acid oxidase [Acinetobacter faecalis]WFP97176.1 alpha-hydroxy acid oxidase [Acinetobacter sp. ANC 7201]
MKSKTILEPLKQIPAYLQTIHDYEIEAEKHLSEMVWSYLQGGSMDEYSVQENISIFKDIQLLPRMLKDLTHGNTECEILGQCYPHPIFLAPIGHQQQFHPDAEAASALAAEVMGSNIILSTFTNTDMRSLKQENPYKWFQLYWQGEREKSLNLVKMAEEHQYKAIVITVDSPHTGIRDRERKAFFHLPENMQHPHTPSHIPLPELKQGDHPVFNGLMRIAPAWDDIAWMVQQTDLPIILKGVTHPQDALLAIQHGVKGLIISNHGGRVLDTCISPLLSLQMIKKVVHDDFPLIYDGGIRRGSDVFKALALGASAVCIGRPYIYGLATAGALGVAHVLKILKEEFEITMALMGTATLKDINKECIFQK